MSFLAKSLISSARLFAPARLFSTSNKSSMINRWTLTLTLSFEINAKNRVEKKGKWVEAARVQQPAPDFKGTAVVNGDFKEIKLDDYKGKYLVLYFYPLDLWVFKYDKK